MNFWFCACVALVVSSCQDLDSSDWTTVSLGTLPVTVAITGNLKATHSISVGPPSDLDEWSFTIAAMAPEGKSVKKGDMLVTFDPASFRERQQEQENERDATLTTIKQRRAEIALAERDAALELAEAQAAVRKATLHADQSDELLGVLVVRKAKLDKEAAVLRARYLEKRMHMQQRMNRATLRSLQAKADEAERDVQKTQRALRRLTVTATTNGTVVYAEHPRTGEKRKVGDKIWKHLNALQVASLDTMSAEGVVDEADAAGLKIGQSVLLRLEAHPDNDVLGTITKIAGHARRKSDEVPTKVIDVSVALEPVEGLQLLPGMQFRGEIETERIEDTLIIPSRAVFPSTKGPFVYRKRGESIEQAFITLGKHDRTMVQILDGLSPNDRVRISDLRREGR